MTLIDQNTQDEKRNGRVISALSAEQSLRLDKGWERILQNRPVIIVQNQNAQILTKIDEIVKTSELLANDTIENLIERLVQKCICESVPFKEIARELEKRAFEIALKISNGKDQHAERLLGYKGNNMARKKRKLGLE